MVDAYRALALRLASAATPPGQASAVLDAAINRLRYGPVSIIDPGLISRQPTNQ